MVLPLLEVPQEESHGVSSGRLLPTSRFPLDVWRRADLRIPRTAFWFEIADDLPQHKEQVVLAMNTAVIVREERHVERRFGPEYIDYKRAVRRWL